MSYFKQSLIRSYPRGFETPEQIASRLTDVVLYGLPDDYFNNMERLAKKFETARSLVPRPEVVQTGKAKIGLLTRCG